MSGPEESLRSWLMRSRAVTSADVVEKMRELKMLPPLSLCNGERSAGSGEHIARGGGSPEHTWNEECYHPIYKG